MKYLRLFEQFITEAEAQDKVELKVDNSGYSGLKSWFKKNTHLFKKHNSGTLSPDVGLKHQDQTKKLEAKGFDSSFPFGYCYPVSQFVFYKLGGYDSDWDLKLIKGIKFKYKGTTGSTTHWFVQHKTNGRIIDLTMEQFDQIPDFDIKELYPEARRANLGFPYYNTNGGKVEFDHTPPCMQVLKLYDHYRESQGKISGLEKYWSAANYATERREKKNEMYDSTELLSLPLEERHNFML